MKKLIIILVLWTAVMVNAQETNQNLVNGFDNQLSVRFSNLTGYGVAYQYNFFEDYAVRTTAWFKYYEYILGPASDYLEKETNKDYNFGVELQRNIFIEDKYRVYAFGGVGYAVKEKINEVKGILENDSKVDDENVTVGLGVGTEYWFLKNLSVDFGLSYKMNFNDGIKYIVKDKIYQPTSEKATGLGVNIGVNFNF